MHCKNMRIVLTQLAYLSYDSRNSKCSVFKENYSVSDYPIAFPVTGFPNWTYVAILGRFLAPVKGNIL